MAIKKELVDELLKGVDPKAVFSCDGLLGEINIVHLLRNSMDYAGWKDRKPVLRLSAGGAPDDLHDG